MSTWKNYSPVSDILLDNNTLQSITVWRTSGIAVFPMFNILQKVLKIEFTDHNVFLRKISHITDLQIFGQQILGLRYPKVQRCLPRNHCCVFLATRFHILLTSQRVISCFPAILPRELTQYKSYIESPIAHRIRGLGCSFHGVGQRKFDWLNWILKIKIWLSENKAEKKKELL